MQVIKPAKITTTIKHKQTGEIYKTEEEWKAKGIEEKDIRRDVHVLMPKLDLFSKTKQVQNLGEIMTKPHRQKYGLGSIIKKAAKGLKKVVKSPIGKAALIGGLGYLAPKEESFYLKVLGQLHLKQRIEFLLKSKPHIDHPQTQFHLFQHL